MLQEEEATAVEKADQQDQVSETSEQRLNRRQRKEAARMSVFELKMATDRPDLVQPWDITAPDPKFLLKMK